eukprot:scaffold6894_cov73-Cylindrotheca_fusiformis.AAC.2
MASYTSESSSSSSSSSSYISCSQNSSNHGFYSRRSSLLVHPVGLKLMRKYAGLMKNLTPELKELAISLKGRLVGCCYRGTEAEISSNIRKFLKEDWAKETTTFKVSDEREEYVEGTLFGSREISGYYPDIVVRKDKFSVLIIEVSVDDHDGGEKKVEQAFEYASLIDKPNDTVLLVSLQFNRREKRSPHLKISEEAFLYCHDENERKFGFLWREVYDVDDDLSPKNAAPFMTACEGMVRSIDCSSLMAEAPDEDVDEWVIKSDNVVVIGKKKVYKIFDNRFYYPTYRRPDVWLRNDLQDWIEDFNVETEFWFKESDNVDDLGKPLEIQKYTPPDIVGYPKGSVLVIRYKYLEGTHFASKASHFEQVAKFIASMHKDGIIHGDVRGFNMLHPHPEPKQAGGIKQSRLIDFDLSGPSGTSVYPPGFNKTVPENVYVRIGKPWEEMKKHHDCYELASTMAKYQIRVKMNGRDMIDLDLTHDWNLLCKSIRSTESATDVARMIRDFINQCGGGDIDISLSSIEQEKYEGLLKENW